MTTGNARSEVEERIRTTTGLVEMIDEIAKRPASEFCAYARRPRH